MIRLRPRTVPDAILRFTGTVCTVLGFVSSVGWLFHLPVLARVGPSATPMAANTAAGLFLDGLALLSVATGRPWGAWGGAIGSLLAGGLTLAEYVLSKDLHIDEFWVRDFIGAYAGNPGRMAPHSALCFVLAGVALVWVAAPRPSTYPRKASTFIGVLGAVILAVGTAAVAGCLTNFPLHANTGVGLASLGLGVLTFAWEFGGRERAGAPRWLGLAAGCALLTVSLWLGDAFGTWLQSMLPLAVIVFGALVSVLFVFIVELNFTSKQRAEDAELANTRLRVASSELAAIHANAPVALLVVDHDLRVEKVNALASQFAGTDRSVPPEPGPGDVIGCLNALCDPRGCGYSSKCAECAIRQAILGGVRNGEHHTNLEAWLPFSIDGRPTQRCLLISVVPLQLEGARKALVCAQDLTSRKQAELELQRQAELIDLSHDAIIRTDAARTIRGWNTGAEELYGWKASEAAGQTIYTLLATAGAVPAEIDQILARDGRWEGTLVHKRRDGQQVIMESRQVLVRDGDGAPAEILEINRDITERERARQELVAAHDRITAILDSISDGFNFFDRDWRYTYVNPAAARLVRKTPEELLGQNVWELWPHAADSPFGVAYRRAVAENIPLQFEAFYPEPLNAWFEVRCYPWPGGLSLFFTDTTARKRDEKKLQETVRALESALAEKTVLLKEIHHRVKNNLAVITSLLSMRAGASEEPAVRRALEDSQQRVHSIALIHEQLYGNDRLDRIDFADYARELVDQLCAAQIDPAERVSVRLESDPIEIAIHRAVPCGLILNELLTNVFKHAFPNGRTGNVLIVFKEVVVEDGAKSLELAVEDDGVGLKAGWEKSKSLGLQIMRILARQLDGTLTAEEPRCSMPQPPAPSPQPPSSLSQAPSSGARWVLRFPPHRR